MNYNQLKLELILILQQRYIETKFTLAGLDANLVQWK